MRVRLLGSGHASSILAELNRCRESRRYCDVTLNVGNVMFAAHSAVLACSGSYFRNLLSNTSTSSSTFSLQFISSASFEKLLTFVYTGEVLTDLMEVGVLCELAQRLGVDQLVKACHHTFPDLQSSASDKPTSPGNINVDSTGMIAASSLCSSSSSSAAPTPSDAPSHADQSSSVRFLQDALDLKTEDIQDDVCYAPTPEGQDVSARGHGSQQMKTEPQDVSSEPPMVSFSLSHSPQPQTFIPASSSLSSVSGLQEATERDKLQMFKEEEEDLQTHMMEGTSDDIIELSDEEDFMEEDEDLVFVENGDDMSSQDRDLLNELSEGESDEGEESNLAWVDSAEESTSLSDSEPPRKVRLSQRSYPPPHGSEACVTDPSLAHEVGKDGSTVWSLVEPVGGAERSPQPNIFTECAGPSPHAQGNILDKLSAFQCLCDDILLEHVRGCTVAAARGRGQETGSWDLTLAELKAFIALLYVRGAYCGKNIDVGSFWAEDWGNAFFIATLSRTRFREIMRYLCFDQKETRRSRVIADKFAQLREVWDHFTQNCIASFQPGSDITVAQQRFTQYTPNTQDKSGFKFWMAADVESKYFLTGCPYLEKDDNRPITQRRRESLVLGLLEPFVGKGRNVTTDDSVTSIPLANALLSMNTSLVGNISKHQRELPPSVKDTMKLFSTKLLKQGQVVLSVYQREPRKNVPILSTRHHNVDILTDHKREPETVTYYNRTKIGVDALVQMAHQFSVRGSARRWPVAAFYLVLDLAAINAWVLYRGCMGDQVPRRDFMLQLAQELRSEWMVLKQQYRVFGPLEDTEERKRVKCMVKARCKQNKTFMKCLSCRKPVCGKCTARELSVCAKCV
ncbi:uncharacterized protein zbtb39 isoform X2 [Gouania willdenowi]|uniref:uncharacterized protein zbtb39 isoform X2 n=1 Tax=Gouania willdenowi TaxID=441366 RepID=UPI001054B7BF|nr:zinc finger and BTB domain-containing protein 39 isoform X2 [Gouania willdenowi]